MTRALVTGAGGFIGSRVLSALRARGLDCLGTARKPGPGLLPCDLLDAEAVARLLREAAPKAVVHAAGSLLSDPRGPGPGYHNNLVSTANLARAAAEAGVERLVFLSSNAVYGAGYRVEKGREPEPKPHNWYARSKLLGEALLRDAPGAPECVALRLPSVTGPGKRSGDVVSDLVLQARETGTASVYGSGASRRPFLDVEDAAELVRLCLDAPLSGRFLSVAVAGAPALPVRELARMAVAALGRGRVVLDPGRGDPPDQWVDPEIARSALGFSARVSPEDGVRRVLEAETSR